MSSYLDYMMYGNNAPGAPGSMYEQRMAQLQQQLSQYQQSNPYSSFSQFQNPIPPQQPIMPQQMIQPQPVQPPQDKQNDIYLQSLFMEFLRSPEMQDFTTTFYSKFSQFYKNKTGLDYNEPGFINNQLGNMVSNMQPSTPTQSQPQIQIQPKQIQVQQQAPSIQQQVPVTSPTSVPAQQQYVIEQ